LTAAPELKATTLARSCYSSMFNGCTNLTSAPVLPATTLADHCYYAMFYGCASLTAAPELPATTLAESCYGSMFYNCKSLSTVTMLAPVSEIYYMWECYSSWLYDGAGTEANSRTLKVRDEAAYNMLEGNGLLPDIWKIGTEGTKVLNKDNTEIK
ncbi:MAG: hypothetical protein ACM691_06930, partial [Phascolarctobacterium sp.]